MTARQEVDTSDGTFTITKRCVRKAGVQMALRCFLNDTINLESIMNDVIIVWHVAFELDGTGAAWDHIVHGGITRAGVTTDGARARTHAHTTAQTQNHTHAQRRT